MWFSSWLPKQQCSDRGTRRRMHRSPGKRVTFRPTLEALEDRVVPSTLTVTNNSDTGVKGDGSLRGEIAAAHNGDTIKFALSPGSQTIKLNSELVINKNLDIEGPGATKLTISGQNASRVFDLEGSNTHVEIEDLTIANGQASGTTVAGPLGNATLGGAILNDQANLTLSDVTVSNNQASGFLGGGGGIANIAGANLTVQDCTFSNNRVSGTSVNSPGGAIFSDGDSTLDVEGSTFTGNQAIDGGAIAVLGGSQATVTFSNFADNRAQGNNGSSSSSPTPSDNGGAIAALGESLVGTSTNPSLTVSHSTFTGNEAIGSNGGAGGAGDDGGNGGQGAGGAIGILGAQPSDTDPMPAQPTADIHDCVFTNNQALGGIGGTGSTGHNGGAGGAGSGGALALGDGILTLTDSTFLDNQAVGGIGGAGGKNGDGGAGGIGRGGAFVHTVSFGTSTPHSSLSDVLMRDNQATGGAGGAGGVGGNGGDGGAGQGGGIRALLGTIDVSHSLLSANQATGGMGGAAGAGGVGGSGGAGQGGGFLTAFGVTAVLADTALLGNQATGGSGATGGNGGDGQGGGIFNGGPSPFGTPNLTLLGCLVALNEADGGAAGAGGSGGQGIGGGVYNLGTFLDDLATLIARNHASTSNDNIFPT
ncbi:MAG TPA: right-handed parallel beta-helix repeat-containing protein [Gemmataceae bacterium]